MNIAPIMNTPLRGRGAPEPPLNLPHTRPAQRRPLWWLLLLFAVPLAGAFWLYYGSSWRPTLRTNHGELIAPVVQISGATFRGKWSLVVIASADAGCDSGCQERLIYARQTWLSLGKLVPRVQRVLVAGAGCCDATYLRREHQGLVQANRSDLEATLKTLSEPVNHAIFIVDPLGNLMMRYDVGRDPKGLRDDLKTLLELSHIG